MLKAAAIALALATLALPTRAQLYCMPADEQLIAQMLASEWGEGERARTSTAQGEVVLYENSEKRTWTIVLFPREQPGVACAAGAGEGEPPALPGQAKA